jgi:hypothetical protein
MSAVRRPLAWGQFTIGMSCTLAAGALSMTIVEASGGNVAGWAAAAIGGPLTGLLLVASFVALIGWKPWHS